jgi:hypothetical protein
MIAQRGWSMLRAKLFLIGSHAPADTFRRSVGEVRPLPPHLRSILLHHRNLPLELLRPPVRMPAIRWRQHQRWRMVDQIPVPMRFVVPHRRNPARLVPRDPFRHRPRRFEIDCCASWFAESGTAVPANAVSLRFFNRRWMQIDADENPRISLFICVHPRPSAVQFFALHV